ncbi:MAG TPA: TIGR00282 family metallophosphoesterase [Patescibacteria group bacterium]|nr:TIGR00282 family metallophosphoesterase [Patescibacteria group bacterium]
MKILFLGDVVGRNAREAAIAQLPELRRTYKLDVIIVNVENAAHGFGVTAQICDDFYKAGADCLTTGNHVWDQREILSYIERDPKLLRPLNFPEGTPGKGAYVIQTAKGEKILVANLMARLFMDTLDDPFAAANKLCNTHRLGKDVNAIFIDFHGEASSEKMALGHYLDGRASFVVGTHTHVPSADARVLAKGTGYMTDAGMCGPYDSVIGMEASLAVNRFVRKVPGEKLYPADGPVTLCGVIAHIDNKTGLCTKAEPLRMGGSLSQALPEVA